MRVPLLILLVATACFAAGPAVPGSVDSSSSLNELIGRIPRAPAVHGKDRVEIEVAQSRRESAIIYAIRDIAALRESAKEAGPDLVSLLNEKSPDVKVSAARALGYIGYTPVTVLLTPLLASTDDWRLVYVSAESLGRLKAPQALPQLSHTAADHWSPVVRQAAAKAIKVIEGVEAYPPPPKNPGADFFEYENLSYTPNARSAKKANGRTFVSEADAVPSDDFEAYSFDDVGQGEGRQKVSRIKLSPSCVFRFHGGLLIGAQRGEFGGALVFQDEEHIRHLLLLANTYALHRMPFGVVATVDGMGLDSGALYLISAEPGKKPVARFWKALPSAPIESGILENGDLFISCHNGDVRITPSGEIRKVEYASP